MPKYDSNAVNLPCKYRPKTLTDLRGQPHVVQSLLSFVASVEREPASAAFVFHGPTGVGKTAAAWALAFDLGCPHDQPDLGGMHEVPSGMQDGRAVEDLLRSLRFCPLFGWGWKIAIINEADGMTVQAEQIWLDALENLPPKTVVIFTTNELGRLSDRLLSRCEILEFLAGGEAFEADVAKFIKTIWKKETGASLKAIPADLGRFDMAGGTLSIRLALQQIAPYIRSKQPLPASFAVPLIRDVANGVCQSGSAAAKKAWQTRKRKAVQHG